MRNVVRAIIIKNDSLLALKRVKNGDTYWVFPGGGVEVGESNVVALVRECKEELGLDVEVLEPMLENIHINKGFGDQQEYFYRCKIVGGQLGTGEGPEYALGSHYVGTYEPCWIKLSELPNLDLRPMEIKNNLLKKNINIKQKLVSPVLMWFIVAVGIFVVFQFVPARFVFPRNMFTPFLIFPALAYWLYFFIGAVKVHRKAPLSADKIDKLVTEGVYGKVRHPIYSADIIVGWAIFFFYPDVRFLIGAHWLMFVLLFWMRREEKALIEKFGDEYLEYKKRVPKMFPRF